MTEQADVTRGIRVGHAVYLDGQLGLAEDGHMVASSDPLAQAMQCFANVDRGLRALGAHRRDIVRLVCYLADMSHLPAYQQARQRFLGSLRPAVTTVAVAALAHPEAFLEIEATAIVAAGRTVQ